MCLFLPTPFLSPSMLSPYHAYLSLYHLIKVSVGVDYNASVYLGLITISALVQVVVVKVKWGFQF